MIICVDCDNILNDFTEKLLVLYNTRYGKNLQLQNIATFNFYDCLSQEDADGITALFKEKELWDSLSPLPKSQQILEQLVEWGHTVYIATATDPINFSWKCAWLKHYFSFIPTSNIIRINNKSLLKCDVMIDDHIDNLTSNICERIIMDYPWNQNKEKDYVYDIYRATNWSGIPKIIRKIERKSEEWKNAI